MTNFQQASNRLAKELQLLNDLIEEQKMEEKKAIFDDYEKRRQSFMMPWNRSGYQAPVQLPVQQPVRNDIVDLSNRGLKDEEAQIALEAVEDKELITTIHLSNNNLTGLPKALKGFPNVSMVSVDGNIDFNITPSTAEWIPTSIKTISADGCYKARQSQWDFRNVYGIELYI